MSSLYILEIRPLSEVSLANMVSHMVGSLFILMLCVCVFFLAVQKLFILMKSYLFFPLADIEFEAGSERGELEILSRRACGATLERRIFGSL